MKSGKIRIEKVIREYVKIFPFEFEAFKKGMQEKRLLQKNDFASTKGSHVIRRALFEIPETLETALKMKLNQEELEWLFQSKDASGAKWFAKEYEVFRVGKEV